MCITLARASSWRGWALAGQGRALQQQLPLRCFALELRQQHLCPIRARPLFRKQLSSRSSRLHRPLLLEHLLPSGPGAGARQSELRPSSAILRLRQELRPSPEVPLLRQHLLALLLAPGGAVGEVVDEALFIFLASLPRGGLAASTSGGWASTGPVVLGAGARPR